MEKFHTRLLAVRRQNNLTQKKLAEALKVSETTIIHYEKGTRLPSINFVDKLVEKLDCDPTWLITGKKAVGSTCSNCDTKEPIYQMLDTVLKLDEDSERQKLLGIIYDRFVRINGNGSSKSQL
jgi:transcriptional regulator with XRE-family HTH domain